jgi:Uma2 family endonuclease
MFVSKARLSEISETESFLSIAPDLAVGVISPSDPWIEVEAKIEEYFQAGVKLVWVLEPKTKKVYVYRSPTEVRILSETDSLSGEEVILGFAIPVSDLFR